MTEQRRDALRRLLAEHSLDALLVTTLVNVRYLTGFTGSAAQLLVTREPAGDVFTTDGRYDEQSGRQVPDIRRLIVPRSGWVAAALGSSGRLGVEAHTMPWADVRDLQSEMSDRVVAAGRLVEQLRAVKDDDEIAALRTACAVADDAFAQMTGWLSPGMTERQAAARLNAALVDAGSTRAFDMIFATGPNTAVPHHRPGERVLQRGDVVKVDFGAVIDGYHSDMTRMLSLGPLRGRLADAFDVVRVAQQRGLDAAADAASTAAVDKACRRTIDDAGFAGTFIHGTGHGVGLEIHEDPFLRPDVPRPEVSAAPSVTLRAGMTLTVEPGIYLPGVGGVRLEDCLVVTPAGPDILTRTPKDLVVL